MFTDIGLDEYSINIKFTFEKRKPIHRYNRGRLGVISGRPFLTLCM